MSKRGSGENWQSVQSSTRRSVDKQHKRKILALSFLFLCFRFWSSSCAVRPLQFVILDHWIRQQVAAKTAQSLLKIDIIALQIDFHVFTNPHTLHFRHSKVSHRVAHGVSLWVEDSFLGLDDYVKFHVNTLARISLATSARQHLYDASDSREYRRCNG